MTPALALVDAASTEPVLVAGSLPPEGRDLDLLTGTRHARALGRALAAEGFVRSGTTWARFGPFELVDLGTLHDPAMLRRARPLEGCRQVLVPDPADALRLTARSYAGDGRLTDGRRVRADVPDGVWAEARSRGDVAALDDLADALAGRPPSRTLARVAARARRMRRAGVVAISGVDGAGKSTQATLLRDALERTGTDVAVEWNRLSHDAWLDTLARPVKRLLRRGGSSSGAPSHASSYTGHDRASEVRDGQDAGRLLGQVWVVLVALANVASHVRSVQGHRLAGRVVICDRYVLDSVVHLEAHYAAGPGRRLATVLVRRLSPRPRAAFYLGLTAEAALARKSDPTTDARVAQQVAAYESRWDELGVHRVDATLSPEEIGTFLAREAWRRI